MCYWSHYVAMTTDPGTVKSKVDTSDDQGVVCKKCGVVRHHDQINHCSTCKRCVELLHHHCPWISNCVGKGNFRPFLLYLKYLTFCSSLMLAGLYYSFEYINPVSGRGIQGVANASLTPWNFYGNMLQVSDFMKQVD